MKKTAKNPTLGKILLNKTTARSNARKLDGLDALGVITVDAAKVVASGTIALTKWSAGQMLRTNLVTTAHKTDLLDVGSKNCKITEEWIDVAHKIGDLASSKLDSAKEKKLRKQVKKRTDKMSKKQLRKFYDQVDALKAEKLAKGEKISTLKAKILILKKG